MTRARALARQGLNAILRPTGSRVLSASEDHARERRYRDVVDQLHDVYVDRVVPALRPRPGRRALIHALIGTQVPEAMFLLQHLQDALDSGGGDVVEMGVAQGATSALLANEILEDDHRSLWLYDSFRGLSRPTPEDELIDDVLRLGSMAAYEGSMASPQQWVIDRVEATGLPRSRTHVVPGYIQDRSPVPESVAFAYLDFDLYEPILVGLRLLHRAGRPGSIFMVDDYGFLSSGPQKAVGTFMSDRAHAYDLLEPPPGSGFFCALRRR